MLPKYESERDIPFTCNHDRYARLGDKVVAERAEQDAFEGRTTTRAKDSQCRRQEIDLEAVSSEAIICSGLCTHDFGNHMSRTFTVKHLDHNADL